MHILLRHPHITLTLLSAVALVGAFVAEYGFGLAPCELCLLQRIPFFVVIGLGCTVLIIKRPIIRKTLLILMIFALLTNSGIATYHTGVEQKWWTGPGSCSGEMLDAGSVDDLRQQILQAPVVRCDEPALEYFGFLTMASANIFYSLLLAILGMVALRKKRAICCQ